MWGHPAKKLKQFRERATLLALVGLAFAVGVGAGALALTAQMAEARASVPVWGDPTADLVAALEAPPDAYEASLFRLKVVAAAAAASDVHSVASALTVRFPSTSGSLYDAASIARMVPGERSSAYLTYYYCYGDAVGDGGEPEQEAASDHRQVRRLRHHHGRRQPDEEREQRRDVRRPSELQEDVAEHAAHPAMDMFRQPAVLRLA